MSEPQLQVLTILTLILAHPLTLVLLVDRQHPLRPAAYDLVRWRTIALGFGLGALVAWGIEQVLPSIYLTPTTWLGYLLHKVYWGQGLIFTWPFAFKLARPVT